MTFLAVLIVLFLYRNWGGENPLRDSIDARGYFARMYDMAPPGWRYLLSVGLPVAMLFVVAEAVDHWLQGLVWLALSLLTLTYCLDFHDVEQEFFEHKEKLRAVSEDDDLADVVQLQEEFQIDHLHGMFQGIVPSLFWFLVFGPAGALAYVLTTQYLDQLEEGSRECELVDQAVHWIEWVPVRITGLLFCLAGNFGPTFDYLLGQLFDTEQSSATHLATMAGLAAEVPDGHDDSVMGFARFAESHVEEMRYLCDRALFGWLGVAAIAVILGA